MADELDFDVQLHHSGDWHSIGRDVRGGGGDAPGGIRIARGRPDEHARTSPGRMGLSVEAGESREAPGVVGRYSPRNPRSDLFGLLGRNTPIRALVDGEVRAAGEVPHWPLEWNTVGSDVYAPLEASGILRRLGQGAKPLESPLRRHYLALNSRLVAYVPLEDGSDTDRMGANVVAGASAIRYAVSGDRRPGWARDDSCPGSAPLPEWPVLSNVAFTVGASVLAHDGPSQHHVTFRVPPGSAPCTLLDWQMAGGTYSRWHVGVNSDGHLFVHASDQADSPSTITRTWSTGTPPVVDDGQWRTVAVTVAQVGSAQRTTIDLLTAAGGTRRITFQDSSTAVGTTRAIRPRPLYTGGSPLDEVESIGLGHAVVVAAANDLTAARLGPADGFAGERTVSRMVRLALDAEVPMRVTGAEVELLDTFDRTVGSGWGTADTGQEWEQNTSSGTVLTAVDAGSATIEAGSTGTPVVEMVAPRGFQDVVVLAVFEVTAGALSVAFAMGGVAQSMPTAVISAFGGTTTLHVRIGPAVVESVPWPLGLDIARDTVHRLRFESSGSVHRARVWLDGDPEPAGWHVTLRSRAPEGDALAVEATFANALGAVVTLHSVELSGHPASARLGPQQRATLIDNLQQAADTDLGIMTESRDVSGTLYRPRHSLYNQDPALVLDYANGEVAPPFHPVEDDQHLANDVTAERIDGSSSRAVDESGPLGVERVGRYDTSVQVNVEDDEDLLSQASWRLHLGTWDEARWPQISVNLRASAFRNNPSLADAARAVVEGDVVEIVNLPEWLPPGPLRVIVQGVVERIDTYRHEITWNCTPAGPWEIGVVGAADGSADVRGQAVDTDHSELAGGIDDSETTLSVATDTDDPLRALWTTDPDDWNPALHGGPLLIDIGGEWMQVTGITGSTSPQTFTVARGANGLTKPHDAGAPVRVAHPMRVGL